MKARRFPGLWILSQPRWPWRCSMVSRCGSCATSSASGWSSDPKIGYAKSLADYLFRWLELRFLKGEQGLLFELPRLAQPQREVTGCGRRLEAVALAFNPPVVNLVISVTS